MQIDLDSIEVVNNKEKKRFEVHIGEHMAIMDYVPAGNTIVFTHTEVPVALEGNGIGSKMAREALAYAAELELKVLPVCPYVAAFIGRHPEYRQQVFGVDKHIDDAAGNG